MNVIVRLGDKKFYYSPVFGKFKESNSNEEWDIYYLVLNESRDKLIKVNLYEDGESTKRKIIELDQDYENLVLDDDGYGCVEYLNENDIDKILNGEDIEPFKLKICKNFYDEMEIPLYTKVKTDDDINNLLKLSNNFHDAYVNNINGNDKKMVVTFDGVWGCSIEMVFEGEILYKNNRTKASGNLVWYDCSLYFNDSHYIVFVDQDDYNRDEDLDTNQCYFMAKRLKYKIIPN